MCIRDRDWPVGVLGLGAIGAKVARAIAADGFPVLGWSRSHKDIDGIECLSGDEGLDRLLSRVKTLVPVSYTHLTLPTICSV